VDGIALLTRVRSIALGLPGVSEMTSHGAPCFFIGEKRPICYFHDHHGGDNRVTIWCPAAPGAADELASVDPEHFFRPQPSASGVFASWIGMVLDPPPGQGVDWVEVGAILEEAFRLKAPRRLVVELDDR
jgi:hypothetical protein